MSPPRAFPSRVGVGPRTLSSGPSVNPHGCARWTVSAPPEPQCHRAPLLSPARGWLSAPEPRASAGPHAGHTADKACRASSPPAAACPLTEVTGRAPRMGLRGAVDQSSSCGFRGSGRGGASSACGAHAPGRPSPPAEPAPPSSRPRPRDNCSGARVSAADGDLPAPAQAGCGRPAKHARSWSGRQRSVGSVSFPGGNREPGEHAPAVFCFCRVMVAFCVRPRWALGD